MKYLAFRFDVDTPKCLEKGVPQLLELAKRKDVKFTFFVHVGKSINLKTFILNKLKSKKINIYDENIKQLSAFKKLGLVDYVNLTITNPKMGEKYSEIINQIYLEGHEIGLHGGKNHEDWNQDISSWKISEIRNQIDWGERELKKINKKIEIKGFAGPHWKYSKKSYKVLNERGYMYVSDIHTDSPNQKARKSFNLIKNIPVNIVGEPGGVGYVEWCRANKMNDIELLNDFKCKLDKRVKIATVYDHPYYTGTSEIKILSQMLDEVKKRKYSIVTFSKMSKVL